MEHPQITNEALFLLKIFDALRSATTFQPSNDTFLYKDEYFIVNDISGEWKVKVEFIKNNSTWRKGIGDD